MYKLFLAAAIVATFAVSSALAGDCCCSEDTGSTPAVASAEHETKTAAGADQSEQAQRWNETRSYSYEPSYRQNYRQNYRGTIDGFYAGTIDQDPRIIGSFGHRPASDKNLGKY